MDQLGLEGVSAETVSNMGKRSNEKVS